MNTKPLTLKIWIWLLLLLAGFVNIVALNFFAQSVSHYTGNITNLALSLTRKNTQKTLTLLIGLISFFCGAFISGIIFYTRSFTPKKRYGFLLLAFSASFLLLFFKPLTQHIQIAIISFLMGIQNSMFIYYDTILIRTTHITGYLTDAAFCLGGFLRGKKQELAKSFFYLMSILCFFSGSIIATLIKTEKIFLIISVAYLVIACYYFIARTMTT